MLLTSGLKLVFLIVPFVAVGGLTKVLNEFIAAFLELLVVALVAVFGDILSDDDSTGGTFASSPFSLSTHQRLTQTTHPNDSPATKHNKDEKESEK